MKAQPMQLAAIRETRAQKVSEARSLLNSANGGNLTPEAQSKFDAIKNQIQDLEGQEARAQFIEEAERRSLGAPVDKARQEMREQVLETPPHLRQDLLDHFMGRPPTLH